MSDPAPTGSTTTAMAKARAAPIVVDLGTPEPVTLKGSDDPNPQPSGQNAPKKASKASTSKKVTKPTKPTKKKKKQPVKTPSPLPAARSAHVDLTKGSGMENAIDLTGDDGPSA